MDLTISMKKMELAQGTSIENGDQSIVRARINPVIIVVLYFVMLDETAND